MGGGPEESGPAALRGHATVTDRLSDWLGPDRVIVGAAPESLEEALQTVLEVGARALGLAPAQVDRLARDLAREERGEIVRLHGEAVFVGAEQEGLRNPVALVLTARRPFPVPVDSREGPAQARGLVLLAVPSRLTAYRARVVPELRRALGDEGVAQAFVSAETAAGALEVAGLDRIVLPGQTQVGAAVLPARYRVYPDTPLDELLDLMVRRSLHAVPVVGDDYEVLGIVTAGDALSHLLARQRQGGEGGAARDIMTRAVLCVSEDQELSEVARLMVNRDVEQLPVVREGRLVGFVTRDTVLASLFEGTGRESDSDTDAQQLS